MSKNGKNSLYKFGILIISLLVLGLVAYSLYSGIHNKNGSDENDSELSNDKILSNKKINLSSKSDVAEFKFKNYTLEKVYRDDSDKKMDYKTGASFTKDLPKEYFRVTLKYKLTNLSDKTFNLSYGETTLIDGKNRTFNSLGSEINNSFSYEGLHDGVLKPGSSKNVTFYLVGSSKDFFEYNNMTLNNDGFGDPTKNSDDPSEDFSDSFDYKFSN